jgi:Uma2 family endonuclease
MTTPVAETLLTAEEYALTTDAPGMVSELVRGKVVRMPPPGATHGRCAARIANRLAEFAEPRGLGQVLGEAGFILHRDPDTVRAPDASFVAADRLGPRGLPEEGYLEGAPTLAVEVVSASEADGDVRTKVAEYLAAGASRVWEVRPRLKTVTVHRPDGDPVTKRSGETLTSDDAGFAAEGFALSVAQVFA